MHEPNQRIQAIVNHLLSLIRAFRMIVHQIDYIERLAGCELLSARERRRRDYQCEVVAEYLDDPMGMKGLRDWFRALSDLSLVYLKDLTIPEFERFMRDGPPAALAPEDTSAPLKPKSMNSWPRLSPLVTPLPYYLSYVEVIPLCPVAWCFNTATLWCAVLALSPAGTSFHNYAVLKQGAETFFPPAQGWWGDNKIRIELMSTAWTPRSLIFKINVDYKSGLSI